MTDVSQIMQMIINNSALSSNPIFQNTYRMYQQHDSEGLKRLAENLCRENGISIEDMKNRLGLK